MMERNFYLILSTSIPKSISCYFNKVYTFKQRRFIFIELSIVSILYFWICFLKSRLFLLIHLKWRIDRSFFLEILLILLLLSWLLIISFIILLSFRVISMWCDINLIKLLLLISILVCVPHKVFLFFLFNFLTILLVIIFPIRKNSTFQIIVGSI
jgi:hypothetical protein